MVPAREVVIVDPVVQGNAVDGVAALDDIDWWAVRSAGGQ